MLTILEAIQKSADYLQKYNIESPRLNAELMLSEILKCKRFDLYLNFDKPLKQEEINLMRDYLRRRANNEPLQYIIGKAYFYKYEFFINKNVLIPRPETELLIEETLNLYNSEYEGLILDVGCGSGNITISLANELPKTKIVSIDVSDKAIEVAKINSSSLAKNDNISFHILDFLNSEKIKNFINEQYPEKFDAIVSNPPYVAIKDYQSLQKEITDYEPQIAVTDGNDGLTFYKAIAENSPILLKEKGKIVCEIGKDQIDFIVEIFNKNKINILKIVKDYQQIPRIIIGERE